MTKNSINSVTLIVERHIKNFRFSYVISKLKNHTKIDTDTLLNNLNTTNSEFVNFIERAFSSTEEQKIYLRIDIDHTEEEVKITGNLIDTERLLVTGVLQEKEIERLEISETKTIYQNKLDEISIKLDCVYKDIYLDGNNSLTARVYNLEQNQQEDREVIKKLEGKIEKWSEKVDDSLETIKSSIHELNAFNVLKVFKELNFKKVVIIILVLFGFNVSSAISTLFIKYFNIQNPVLEIPEQKKESLQKKQLVAYFVFVN